MDLPNKNIGCHHTGFSKKCRDLVTKGICNRWIQIQGKNPNTGEDINRYDCVDNWTPILLIENSQMQRQTGAAIESFRNENATVNQAALGVLNGVLSAAQQLPPNGKLIEGKKN